MLYCAVLCCAVHFPTAHPQQEVLKLLQSNTPSMPHITMFSQRCEVPQPVVKFSLQPCHEVVFCSFLFKILFPVLHRDNVCLQEAAKIYCLCRQPYDEGRPMLSCDHCNDWFHYDCIGLQPPGDNENDDEVAPEEYRCPTCCMQVTSVLHSISMLLSLALAVLQDSVTFCGPRHI